MHSTDDDSKKDTGHSFLGSGIDRRDLMKIGASAVVTSLTGAGAAAQYAPTSSANAPLDSDGKPLWKKVKSGPGYKNEARRISGNGPMDDTSRKLVSYVTSFSESNLTDASLHGAGTYMLDSLTALIAGFESEPGRICARFSRMMQCDMKSTILGYGVVTSPEMATFANSSMLRHCDYNDAAPGSHSSDIVPGILAIGEALHSTGSQVVTAVALGVEVLAGLFYSEDPAEAGAHWDYKYEGVATALATGKLMGLKEDQLANALSIALVPQIPLFVPHIGALSHWKGCHGPWGARAGVWAAMLAREGLTGPAQPFEERGGLWDNVTGPCKELRLPVKPGQLTIDNMRLKRYPADGNTQAMLEQFFPPIRKFTKIEDIASIEIEMPFPTWQENADPPKWDPQNRETADHSIPYLVAVGLTDGEVYLDAFTPKRWEDPSLRQIMNKITCEANPDFVKPRSRITVRTKAGQELVTDVFEEHSITHDEVIAKFKRVCAYKSVSDGQRDRALAAWTALEKVHDIADTMRDLAHFGKPLPL